MVRDSIFEMLKSHVRGAQKEEVSTVIVDPNILLAVVKQAEKAERYERALEDDLKAVKDDLEEADNGGQIDEYDLQNQLDALYALKLQFDVIKRG